ncbi:hypothetical protein PsorP6_015141 [Peronosclerospora sorghi]|uniref:Uncharacterized protein n=1 Tax=Peronosclerospora sorghi TaxID=230839 RepID=A0ACC0VTJ1_9STRA|nr:hypothetical protein PsorP6_015141 [Peronosclerospora sorghi]
MDLSYAGVVKPTKDVCRQQNLCFYCRVAGHHIAECRKRLQGNADAPRIIVKPGLWTPPDSSRTTTVKARNFEGQVRSLLFREYKLPIGVDGVVHEVPVMEWPLEQPFDGVLGQYWL